MLERRAMSAIARDLRRDEIYLCLRSCIYGATCIVRSGGPVGMQLGSWLDKHGERGEKMRQSNPPFSPPATATTHHLLQSGLVVTVELVRHCLSSSAACPCLSSLSVDFELNCTALSLLLLLQLTHVRLKQNALTISHRLCSGHPDSSPGFSTPALCS